MLRAVVIEMLNTIPLRLGELIGLHLERHVMRNEPGSRHITHITIPALDRKNTVTFTAAISAELRKLLDEWIRMYRPHVASADCEYLFPGHGTGNRPMTPQAVRDAVKSIATRKVGVPLTPHRFRHLAGYHVLAHRPGDYRVVQELLGHKDPRTAQRSYVQHSSEAAIKIFDDILARRKTAQPRRPDRPKVAKQAGNSTTPARKVRR